MHIIHFPFGLRCTCWSSPPFLGYSPSVKRIVILSSGATLKRSDTEPLNENDWNEDCLQQYEHDKSSLDPFFAYLVEKTLSEKCERMPSSRTWTCHWIVSSRVDILQEKRRATSLGSDFNCFFFCTCVRRWSIAQCWLWNIKAFGVSISSSKQSSFNYLRYVLALSGSCFDTWGNVELVKDVVRRSCRPQ